MRKVAGIYIRVLSTTFAIGEHIAVLHRKTISRTEGAYRVREANQKEIKRMNKTIKELAVELTIEITAVCDGIKGRAVFVNQLLRSCSSIGANSYEAKYAQSTADFVNKLEIALTRKQMRFNTAQTHRLHHHRKGERISTTVSFERNSKVLFIKR